MEDLDFPPFLVNCLEGLAVAVQITAYQIENACAAALVFKDLAEQQDGKVQACYPALNRLAFREIDSIYALGTALLFIFLAKRYFPVRLHCHQEMLVTGMPNEHHIFS